MTATRTISWRKPLLLLHIAVTSGLIGADLTLALLTSAGAIGADPGVVYPAAFLVAAKLLQPLALASLISGVAVAIVSGWGLTRYWWVLLKLFITVGLNIALAASLLPGLGKAAEVAVTSGADFVAPMPILVAPVGAASLALLALALSVYKPAWKRQKAREAPSR